MEARAALAWWREHNMAGILCLERTGHNDHVHRQLQLAHDLAQMVQGCLSAAPPAQDHEIDPSTRSGDVRAGAIHSRTYTGTSGSYA